MMRFRSFIALSALALTLSFAHAQPGPGMGQGRGAAARGDGLDAKRVACRTQANQKGLLGPARRDERQKFMQACVHGTN